MLPADRAEYIRRYEGRLREFGYSPASLGWGKSGRQEVRYAVLAAPVLERPDSSILDVGCGFADLYDWLTAHGWRGRYVGIDIVPGLLQVARERHPELDLRLLDIADCTPATGETFDFTIASGMFNARLSGEPNEQHIENGLSHMFALTRSALCVDFMSTHVDFQHPTAWHTDPRFALDVAHRLSRRFLLRHDYMPYEFALLVYCDDAPSPLHVFTATEAGRAEVPSGSAVASAPRERSECRKR